MLLFNDFILQIMKRLLLIGWLLISLFTIGMATPRGELSINTDSVGSATDTANREYTVEKVHLLPTILGSIRTLSNVIYYDGFHRKLQEVSVSATPDGTGDIIIPYVYGVLGRVEREYLPYVRVHNQGCYDDNAMVAENWKIYGLTDEGYAFTQVEYENSLQDRVVKRTGAGKEWHEAGKGETTVYGFNKADEVRRFRISSEGALIFDGTYPVGSLHKMAVTDEDNRCEETFMDSRNREILTVRTEGGRRMETYRVYDERGMLRYVLSPEASARVGLEIDETVIQQFAYHYDYDRWGRMTVKHLPGCAPVYLVYDKRDRPVLTQDGKQRSENAAKWSYTVYDGKNREIETGEVILSSALSHAALQSAASSSLDYMPEGTRMAYKYTQYDSYTPTSRINPQAFMATAGYASDYNSLVAGCVTATKTRILGTDDWFTSTLYYDRHGRVVQTVADNRLGGLSRVDMKYDFVGNLLGQRESHSKNSGEADVLECLNAYDDRGRLLTQHIRLNDGPAATVTNSYDALGRLTGKKYGNVTETLTYNVRGWLTGKASMPFRMSLRYQLPQGGTVACYNGNISEWEWQQGTTAALMYGFAYDSLNRFMGAVEKQKKGDSWVPLAANYTEQGISYDANGNLLALQRTAGGVTVDQLIYSYTGNQLTGLTENATVSSSSDVYPRGNVASGNYSYDANGNLQNDSRKALNFNYNVLNLLNEVYSGDRLAVGYTWLADGTKLGVCDGNGVNGLEYVGSLIYGKSSAGLQLSEALFEDGVIRVGENGSQELNYFLKDHLGSVRVIVDESGSVTERNDYYPFGARHIRSDYAQSANRWKYNGKEIQPTGNPGYLDYGARMYDAGIGRWLSVDPRAEDYLSQSPWHFSGNNPLLFVDADGEDYWSTNDPDLIASFLDGFGRYPGNYLHIFDVSGWSHASDAEVLDGLTYNDKLNRFFFDYGDVENGIATRFVRSLPGYQGLDGNIAIRTVNGMDATRWYQRASGEIQPDYSIDALFIPIGKGLRVLKSWLGVVGKKQVFRSVGAAAARNVGKTLQTGGHTIKSSTAKALGVTKHQLGEAIERLKEAKNIRHDSHQKIMWNGDVVNSHTREIIGNVFDYID